MNEPLVETLKSLARGVYFALLGVVVLILTVVATSPEVAQSTITLPLFNVPLSVGTLIVAGAGGLAKLVDRYIHKSDSYSNGIAPPFLQK